MHVDTFRLLNTKLLKFSTYDSLWKLASTPSDGIGPSRKFVDTLLQTFQENNSECYTKENHPGLM